MLKKLKLLSKTHISALWPLALKSAVFGGLLFLAGYYSSIFWTFIFLVAVFYMYLINPVERRQFVFTFLLLIFYALFLGQFLKSSLFLFLGIAAFSVLWFLLFGVKELLFINRERIFNILSGALYFVTAISFFVGQRQGVFKSAFYLIVTFLAFYLLFKESLELSFPKSPKNKKNLMALGTAFLILQITIAAAFLPLGFLNASIFAILLAFILEDLIFYHLRGNLSRQVVVNDLAILLISAVFIFATSQWRV